MDEVVAASLLTRVRRLARRTAYCSGVPEMAEDLAGGAMLRIVLSEDRYNPERGAFCTFAMSVAYWEMRTLLRREHRRVKSQPASYDGSEDPPGVGAEDPPLVDYLEVEKARAAVAALPERERVAIALLYYDGMTRQELMSFLNLSESRICQLHSMAMLHLRERFAA